LRALSDSAAAALLQRIEPPALAALDRPANDVIDPVVLRFLLRAYVRGVLSDDAAKLEEALGTATDRCDRAASMLERVDWLHLLVDAAAVSDDERVPRACARLAAQLDAEQQSLGIDTAAAAIEARLRAAAALGDAPLLSAAVDDLERLVARAYRPGEPLPSLSDHARLSSALLTGFDITGRIPYAMLAEELVHAARRTWWNTGESLFGGPLETNCGLGGVLQRLAAIHDDADYRARAVVAADADYAADAARLFDEIGRRVSLDDAIECAHLGLALLER
jgi:uncharacterized protein YyaL (SSP411 family)